MCGGFHFRAWKLTLVQLSFTLVRRVDSHVLQSLFLCVGVYSCAALKIFVCKSRNLLRVVLFIFRAYDFILVRRISFSCLEVGSCATLIYSRAQGKLSCASIFIFVRWSTLLCSAQHFSYDRYIIQLYIIQMCINESFIIHVHEEISQTCLALHVNIKQVLTCPKKSLNKYLHVHRAFLQQVILARLKRKDKKALWKWHKEA